MLVARATLSESESISTMFRAVHRSSLRLLTSMITACSKPLPPHEILSYDVPHASTMYSTALQCFEDQQESSIPNGQWAVMITIY